MTTEPTPKPETPADDTAWKAFQARWREARGVEKVFLLVRELAVRLRGWKTPSLGTLALFVVGAWFLFGRSSIFGAAEGGGPTGFQASEGTMTLLVDAILAAQGIALGSRISRMGAGQHQPHGGGYQPRPYQPPQGQYPSLDRPPPGGQGWAP